MSFRRYREKRNFAVTPEPSAREPDERHRTDYAKPSVRPRSFVIQKHAASHLHYDFRLELEGVLKSWSIPKGPSLDPSVKRLAMATEDHPIAYADFEGIIPEGQYGGGTVLVWDRGEWLSDGDPHAALRKGRLRFALAGQKLEGSFVLARTDERRWFLQKLDDRFANRERDITATRVESAASGRTLEQIAEERDRVWHSNRGDERGGVVAIDGARRMKMPRAIVLERAHVVEAPPDGDDWLHEILVDGERVVVRVEAGRPRIFHGNAERTADLPEIIRALEKLRLREAIFDGVLAAMTKRGTTSRADLVRAIKSGEAVLFLVDLLYEDGLDLRRARLDDRKARLAAILPSNDRALRFGDHVIGGGPAFLARGLELGIAGVVSKPRDAPHAVGKKSSWVEVRAASDNEVAGVSISNGDRVMYPKLGVTKIDLARFYARIAEHVMPHVVDRPLTLVRCGEGVAGRCIYLRHAKAWGPRQLTRVKIREQTKVGEYLVVQSVGALVALVQLDILEFHTWSVKVDALETPDRVVFDLDPGEHVAWDKTVGAAKRLRAILADDYDLDAFVKTTGGKGLHVVVPIVAAFSWDEVLAFARRVARALEREDPELYTMEIANKSARSRRLLLDVLRNARANTSVAAFSTRAKPEGTISTPIAWNELDAGVTSESFNVTNIEERLAATSIDPWKSYFDSKQRLRRSMITAQKVRSSARG